MGVSCLTLDLSFILEEILSVLSIPEYERSFTHYYGLLPIYPSMAQQSNPEMIFSIDTTANNSLAFFHGENYQLPAFPLDDSFSENHNYRLRIFRNENNQSYYIVPVSIANEFGVATNILYIMAVS